VDTPEVQELKTQISALNVKFDGVVLSIQKIERILARQEGENLSARLHSTEEEITRIKLYQAQREWIPELVDEHTKGLKNVTKFMYLVTGGMIVLNLIITVAGKFLLDRVFH
jgi:hypothetical protein